VLTSEKDITLANTKGRAGRDHDARARAVARRRIDPQRARRVQGEPRRRCRRAWKITYGAPSRSPDGGQARAEPGRSDRRDAHARALREESGQRGPSYRRREHALSGLRREHGAWRQALRRDDRTASTVRERRSHLLRRSARAVPAVPPQRERRTIPCRAPRSALVPRERARVVRRAHARDPRVRAGHVGSPRGRWTGGRSGKCSRKGCSTTTSSPAIPAREKAVDGMGEAYRVSLAALDDELEITERNLGWTLLGLASYFAIDPRNEVRRRRALPRRAGGGVAGPRRIRRPRARQSSVPIPTSAATVRAARPRS